MADQSYNSVYKHVPCDISVILYSTPLSWKQPTRDYQTKNFLT